jgi:hypothetical protein
MPDELTMAELKTFARDDKGKMSGSPFDDRTMSLAIANYMRKFAFFAEFLPDENPPVGSFSDWEKRLYGETFKELTEKKSSSGKWGKRPERPKIGQYAVRGRTPFR